MTLPNEIFQVLDDDGKPIDVDGHDSISCFYTKEGAERFIEFIWNEGMHDGVVVIRRHILKELAEIKQAYISPPREGAKQYFSDLQAEARVMPKDPDDLYKKRMLERINAKSKTLAKAYGDISAKAEITKRAFESEGLIPKDFQFKIKRS